MEEERFWVDVSVGISPGMADDFLDLLATDDAFRERLTNHPRETLAEYFIVISVKVELPATIKLPPKEIVAAFLDEARKRAAAIGPGPHPPGPVLGFAILYCVLGTVPLPGPPPPPPPPPPPHADDEE